MGWRPKDPTSALALLPEHVARRTVPVEIRNVEIP